MEVLSVQEAHQEAFASNHVDDSGPYTVEFTINYKTDFGKIVCIAGGLKELGDWHEFSKNHMKWTEVSFTPSHSTFRDITGRSN
jgi:hypothetical protein